MTRGLAERESDENPRHCEKPTGRANARPMTGSATKQSSLPRGAGSLRGACHRAALCADPLARNDGDNHQRGCWEPDGIGGGGGASRRGGARQAPALRPAIGI